MNTSKPKRVPITAAKQISQTYNYPEVIVFAYDPVTGKQHITTYGATKAQCKDAAKAADFLKQALKWPGHVPVTVQVAKPKPNPNDPMFTYTCAAQGSFQSSFCFKDKDEYTLWQRTVLPKLKAKYGNVTAKAEPCKPLRVGDTCRVYGEGATVFVIETIEQIEPYRWMFGLDDGSYEEVRKCYPAKAMKK